VQTVQDKVEDVRDTLKGICLHEMLSHPSEEPPSVTANSASSSHTSNSHLCVKLKADAVVEHAGEILVDKAATAATAVTEATQLSVPAGK
jgi:hypothetical protein